jgi:hypothetical protein
MGVGQVQPGGDALALLTWNAMNATAINDADIALTMLSLLGLA